MREKKELWDVVEDQGATDLVAGVLHRGMAFLCWGPQSYNKTPGAGGGGALVPGRRPLQGGAGGRADGEPLGHLGTGETAPTAHYRFPFQLYSLTVLPRVA